MECKDGCNYLQRVVAGRAAAIGSRRGGIASMIPILAVYLAGHADSRCPAPRWWPADVVESNESRRRCRRRRLCRLCRRRRFRYCRLYVGER